MTDSTGVIQHAIYGIPRRDSGYTTDDNARALRLCVRLWRCSPDERMLGRVGVYLSFVEHARTRSGGFHNFMDYRRHWLDAEGAGDCQGQAVRSLAEVLGSDLPEGFRAVARELIDVIAPTLADLRSPRAQAYVILAWAHLWRQGVKDIDSLESVAWSASKRLVEQFERSRRSDWRWFEGRMTYANAVMPHALFAAGQRWPTEEFLDAATTAYDFLDQVTSVDGMFWPIGNDGWHVYGEPVARYDQQPVEAVTMAEAAIKAHEVLGGENHIATLRRLHAWFHGQNSLQTSLVDVSSGACCDGLHAHGLNANQGAESTLAYLWTELLVYESMAVVKSDASAAVGRK